VLPAGMSVENVKSSGWVTVSQRGFNPSTEGSSKFSTKRTAASLPMPRSPGYLPARLLVAARDWAVTVSRRKDRKQITVKSKFKIKER
jgi:hypothetical protein